MIELERSVCPQLYNTITGYGPQGLSHGRSFAQGTGY